MLANFGETPPASVRACAQEQCAYGDTFRTSRFASLKALALPPSWHAAKSRLKLDKPFNFVTTNDIIGGNSGSPMINQRDEIVGLAFDGDIHSLGGAFWFDSRLNRTVAVHSGGILEALNNIYDAGFLVREMTAQ